MSLKILAVDDSRTIRDMLKLALAQAGFAPEVAEDGVHGLEVLEEMAQDGTPPDAIITDINMPRMDGFGFIDAVRAKSAHSAVPILVLSTESAAELKARARASGATGWIVKPFDPVKLVKAINMVAGKGAA
ncbi:MAG: response regulator [Vannielia sp.]|uniref:response regulator n=1 Tax=Rhodobacterales TaxID=204455 RepID=UPI002096257E|nr:response regulator [Oceanicola sp. 502str15]MCO6381916.1 response regulator [Oceanicola sp. 502str15]